MRDLKHVSHQVADHRPPVSIRHIRWGSEAQSTNLQRSSVSVVRVVDVQVEERRKRSALAMKTLPTPTRVDSAQNPGSTISNTPECER